MRLFEAWKEANEEHRDIHKRKDTERIQGKGHKEFSYMLRSTSTVR